MAEISDWGGHWKRVLGSVGFLYGVLVVLGVFVSERLIFPYSGSSYDAGLRGLEMLEAEDGAQVATRLWEAEEERLLVLYFHGNGEDLGHLDFVAHRLVRRDFSVWAVDYRGYGLSEGRATERHAYADAQLLYEHALKRGYSPERIVIWGRSVGSGPAVDLAREREARALVLDSPFVSAFRVLTRVPTRVPLLPFDRFNNLSKIADVEEPLFILHGENDQVIESWHSAELYAAHSGEKERHVIPGAGHNDLWMHDLNEALERLAVLLDLETE